MIPNMIPLFIKHEQHDMSKKEKREQRIRKNRANVSLTDFEALINQ